MNKELMFSSKSNEWETPWALYNALNEEFHFVVDAAATAENHKAPVFYTKETDGLQQSWQVGPVWCNPPYGREIGKWVKKLMKATRNTKRLWSCLFLPGQIHGGFTIIFIIIRKQKSGLLKAV